MADISERLRYAMNLRNMKQAELVEITKINKGAISSYLSGRYKPKQDGIYLLAKALNVSEGWLMGYDVPIERKEYFSMQVSNSERILLDAFNELNDLGKKKAVEYVSDLCENPRYSSSYVPEVIAAHHPTGELDETDRKDISNILKIIEADKNRK